MLNMKGDILAGSCVESIPPLDPRHRNWPMLHSLSAEIVAMKGYHLLLATSLKLARRARRATRGQ